MTPTLQHPPHQPADEPSSAPVARSLEQLSARTSRTTAGRVVSLVVFAGALTLIATCVVRGRDLQRAAPHVFLGAAPLVGRDPHDGWDWRFGLGLVAAGAIAIAVVMATRRMWFWTVRLRTLTAASAVTATAFATALALTDGADGLFRGAAHETEYVSALGTKPPAGEFVRTFIERIDGYSVHVRGHPPGFVLVLKLFAAIGLRGAWPAVMLAVSSLSPIVRTTRLDSRPATTVR